jgi:hypothetical protein
MLALNSRPVAEMLLSLQRDFLTSEEELPAAVDCGADSPYETMTRVTEVRSESTDDN